MSLNLIERIRVYAIAGNAVAIPADDARTLCTLAETGLARISTIKAMENKLKVRLGVVFWLIAFNALCTAWLVLT